jgi:hypothetical protein
MNTGKLSLATFISCFAGIGVAWLFFGPSHRDPVWWIVLCTVCPAVSLLLYAIARKAVDWPKKQSL